MRRLDEMTKNRLVGLKGDNYNYNIYLSIKVISVGLKAGSVSLALVQLV